MCACAVDQEAKTEEELNAEILREATEAAAEDKLQRDIYKQEGRLAQCRVVLALAQQGRDAGSRIALTDRRCLKSDRAACTHASSVPAPAARDQAKEGDASSTASPSTNLSNTMFDARVISLSQLWWFLRVSGLRGGAASLAAINRMLFPGPANPWGPDAAAAIAAAAPPHVPRLRYSGFSAPGRSTLSTAVVDVLWPDRHRSEALHLSTGAVGNVASSPPTGQNPHANSTASPLGATLLSNALVTTVTLARHEDRTTWRAFSPVALPQLPGSVPGSPAVVSRVCAATGIRLGRSSSMSRQHSIVQPAGSTLPQQPSLPLNPKCAPACVCFLVACTMHSEAGTARPWCQCGRDNGKALIIG